MKTNELHILDIEKMKKMREIKPRKNPLHERFVDNWEHVFNKFGFKNKHYFTYGFNLLQVV